MNDDGKEVLETVTGTDETIIGESEFHTIQRKIGGGENGVGQRNLTSYFG